jgi:hypothetical protein
MSKHTELVEDAVKVLREMPGNMQATAAQVVLDYAAGNDDFLLSDEQVAEVERRMANPDRAFLSVREVREPLHHFGV